MSNQSSYDRGSQDANSGKGPANQQGQSYQDRQSYDAGYKYQQQQQQSQPGKK